MAPWLLNYVTVNIKCDWNLTGHFIKLILLKLVYRWCWRVNDRPRSAHIWHISLHARIPCLAPPCNGQERSCFVCSSWSSYFGLLVFWNNDFICFCTVWSRVGLYGVSYCFSLCLSLKRCESGLLYSFSIRGGFFFFSPRTLLSGCIFMYNLICFFDFVHSCFQDRFRKKLSSESILRMILSIV